MKLTSLVSLALAAASVSAVPAPDSSPVVEVASGPSPALSPDRYNLPRGPGFYNPNRGAVQNALSTLIGAFAIGASKNPADLAWACNGRRDSPLYAPWKAFTSPVGERTLQATICRGAERIPPMPEIIDLIRRSTAQIFVNQVLKSFPLPYWLAPVWRRVCIDLDYERLATFGVNSTYVDSILSVCYLSGMPAQPREAHMPAGPINGTALEEFRKTQTALTARTLYVAISTRERLRYVCERFDQYVPFLTGAQMDVPLFKSELCGQPVDLPTSSAHIRVEKASSYYYSLQLLNAGTSFDWKKFLCDNLSPREMEQVGLDGDLVNHAACEGPL